MYYLAFLDRDHIWQASDHTRSVYEKNKAVGKPLGISTCTPKEFHTPDLKCHYVFENKK